MFYNQFSTLSKYRVVQKDVSISLSLSFHIISNWTQTSVFQINHS